MYFPTKCCTKCSSVWCANHISLTSTFHSRGLQAAVSQHEHNGAVLTQRLHEAGEAIASHEEMADALTREIHDLRSANEGGDSAYAAMRQDLKIA